MAAKGAWIYCSCGHIVDEHAEGGQCREKNAYGYKCECTSVDTDEPDGEA